VAFVDPRTTRSTMGEPRAATGASRWEDAMERIETGATSNGLRWAGRAMSGLAIAFLGLDGVAKLFKPAAVVEGTIQLGYPESTIVPLGIALLVGVVAYAIPRTAALGAILLTGYLGGAIATHVRVGNPLLTHTLFPIYVALLVWGGLYLRDAALRSLIPLRR
jgi:hypothetical protein